MSSRRRLQPLLFPPDGGRGEWDGACDHPRAWLVVAVDSWLVCGYCGAPLERLTDPDA